MISSLQAVTSASADVLSVEVVVVVAVVVDVSGGNSQPYSPGRQEWWNRWLYSLLKECACARAKRLAAANDDRIFGVGSFLLIINSSIRNFLIDSGSIDLYFNGFS